MRGATVTLEMENVSDLKENRISELSSAFQDELQRQGVKISPKDGNAKIRLAISRNASAYLGIARLERNESSEIFLESFGQPAQGFSLQESEGLTLRRELIFFSDQPILDLLFPR